jgi:hypothetical protein
METMSSLDVFEALQKLPDRESTKKIADYMDESKRINMQNMKDVFVTKEDLLRLKDELKDHFNNRFWIIFITLAGMIIGLYFKH